MSGIILETGHTNSMEDWKEGICEWPWPMSDHDWQKYSYEAYKLPTDTPSPSSYYHHSLQTIPLVIFYPNL